MNADDGLNGHAGASSDVWQALIDGALRGRLSAADRARLDGHLATCPICAVELEAMSTFHASLASRPGDDALDLAVVDRAMARLREGAPFKPAGASELALEDQALDHAAVDRAMARLAAPETFRARPPRPWRRATGLAAAGVAVAAAIVFAAFQASRPRSPGAVPAIPTVASAQPVSPLILADGSEIAPDDATTAIEVGEQTPAHTTIRIPTGAARFRVRHDSRRLFRVDAGAVQIEDLGTVFRVAHEAEGRVRVTVAEGRVAVRSTVTGLRFELGAGDDRVFSGSTEPGEAREAFGPPVETPKPPPAATAAALTRVQARTHQPDDPAELLAAADVARRARRPRAVVAPLQRFLDRYPKDPRAPSAAFTLGWVYLTDLNRPREAAVAFAQAERIAPRGALAEDAAARVAEAWQKAGESRRATEAARHYVQAYPSGRYTGLMHGLIGDR